ncbi:MAG TPA: sulfotransferase [Acidimicrobiales bacterium]
MTRHDSPLLDRMVFLVGARRSGTNWLRRIVDAHPDVAVIPGETYLFSHGIQPLADRVQHAIAGWARTGFVFMDSDEFLDATRDLCDRIFAGMADVLGVAAPGRIGERTPDHVRHLDLIGSIYPDAWYVHIIRDGRDVSRSLLSHGWGPDEASQAAHEWRTAVETGRSAGAALDRYVEVRYEDLLTGGADALRRLFSALDLDTSDASMDTVERESEVPYNVDPAAGEVAAGKWRSGLTPSQIDIINDEAGQLLVDLGYDVDEPRKAGRSTPSEVTAGPPPPLQRRVLARVRRGHRGDDLARLSAVITRTQTRNQDVVQALLEAITSARWDDAAALLRDRVEITIGRPDGVSWSGRGTAAVASLLDAWRSDRAVTGRQVGGDVYPAVPIYTVSLTFERDGDRFERTLMVGVDEGGGIDRVGWYRHR